MRSEGMTGFGVRRPYEESRINSKIEQTQNFQIKEGLCLCRDKK